MEFLQMSGKKQGKLHVLVHLELNRCLTVSCMLSVTDHIHLITMQLLISTDCRDVRHVFALCFLLFSNVFCLFGGTGHYCQYALFKSH